MRIPARIWATVPFLDQAMASGANFLTGLVMVRSLGLDGYGLYALINTAVLLASTLQQSAIIAPMMTSAPRLNDNSQKTFLQSAAALQVGLAVVSAVVVMTAVWATGRAFDKDIDRAVMTAIPFLVAALQLQDFYRRTYYVLRDWPGLLRFAVVATTLQLGLVTSLWVLGQADVAAMIAALTASAATAATVGLTDLGIDASRVRLRSTAREIWSTARWLVPTAVVQWASSNLIVLIAAGSLGQWAAGALRASQNVVAALNVLFIALENTLPVRAAVLHRNHGDRTLLCYVARRAVAIGSFTALAVAPLVAFPVEVLHLLYGAAFEAHSEVLRGLCAVYLLAGIAIPLRIGLRTIGRARSILVATVIATAASLVVVHPATVAYGIGGTVATLVLAQAIMAAWYALFLFSRSEVR